MSAVRRAETLGAPGQGTGDRHAREQFARLPRRQPDHYAPDTAERRRAGLTDTRNAQPALGIAGYANTALRTRAGTRPLRGGDAR